jgi:hypothetical protein
MVTKALQSGACVFVESSVVKPVRLSSHGKQSVPISGFSCKNSISNAKPHVLTSNATRFQTGNKENCGMNSFPICVDGLTCAEKMKTCPPVTSEKLEEWMKDSVMEIVKHIQEAPFLHYVFDRKSPSASLKKRRDYADMFGKVDSWAKIRNSLRDISPDAVILVQKLNRDISPESEEENVLWNGNAQQSSDQQGRTAVWGLVIQGRSVGVSACYILKTTQIVSANGYCTSFCLTRAKCFGPAHHIQLTNSWLL